MIFFSQKVTSQATLLEENLQRDIIISEHETYSYQKENYPLPTHKKKTQHKTDKRYNNV